MCKKNTEHLVSIITPSYNSAKFISQTIESVLSQTYNNIEYIIIDGSSTDGTIEIIKEYQDKITNFVSEPDMGIYDAMNKGIALATGDVIGILNSDDFYVDDSVIEGVVKAFQQYKVDSVYGDLEYVAKENTDKVVRFWKSAPFKKGLFQKGWHPAHPTFFVKKNIYEKYGCFNLSYRIAADYELMLRLLEKHQIPSYYVPRVLVKMRVGGESNKGLLNIIRANIESYQSWKDNKLPVNLFMFMLKPISKVFQYFK